MKSEESSKIAHSWLREERKKLNFAISALKRIIRHAAA